MHGSSGQEDGRAEEVERETDSRPEVSDGEEEDDGFGDVDHEQLRLNQLDSHPDSDAEFMQSLSHSRAVITPLPSSSRASGTMPLFVDNLLRRQMNDAHLTRLTMPWTSCYTSHFEIYPKTGLERPSVIPVIPAVASSRQLDVTLPAQTQMRMTTGSMLFAAVRRIRTMSWPKQQESLRHLALQRWKMIVDENPQSTVLGKQLHALATEFATDEEMNTLVTDTFAEKSTATLNKRAGSLLQYLVWHRREFGFSGMPPSESKVYRYLKTLDSKSAASVPRSLLGAITFSKHVLGLHDVDDVISSSRIRGSVYNKALDKPPLKQRRKLSVDELRSLHILGRCSPCMHDRYASLFFLAQTYLRSRYSGLCGASKLLPDFTFDRSGFLEAHTLCSKTQTTASAKRTFLPMTALERGVTKDSWAQQFIAEREKQGLSSYRWLLPVPTPGGWLDEPLSVGRAARWLKFLLAQMGHKDLDDVGTHSCKTTLLMWCAAWGLDLPVRSLLGYHVPESGQSVLVYSRDAMSMPLRHLAVVMENIRSGNFNPDVTRSGYFRKGPPEKRLAHGPNAGNNRSDSDDDIPPAQPERESPSGNEHEHDLDDHDSDSGHSSCSTSSVRSEIDVEAESLVPTKRRPVPGNVAGVDPYFHPISRILHMRPHLGTRFRCNRVVSSNFMKTEWRKAHLYLNCLQCFPK